MKNFKTLMIAAALAAAMFAVTGPARAQVDPSAPIVVRSSSNASTSKNAPGTKAWLKAEIIHADAVSMVVREQANGMMIHTFTYGPEIGDHMQQIVDAGGYHYGDKVKILYLRGQTVALKIRGKPSNP
jgi:hypothetical protein